jgi:DNA-binding Lrp family transcriptional regulator
MDELDFKILGLLQANAKLTIKELATALGMTTSPVFERLKRLEREGVIERYVAILNAEKVGKPLVVFCNVSMPQYNPANIQSFEACIQQMPEVLECYHLAGTIDYQLKIVVQDIKAYNVLLMQIAQIPTISVHSSMIALHEVKNSTMLPLS